MDYDSSVFLVTLDDFKTYLGYNEGQVSDNTILGHILQIVREQFDEFTERALLEADHTDYYNGTGRRKLLLRNYPVNSTIDSIAVYVDQDQDYESDTQVDADDIAIDSNAGILYRVGGYWAAGEQNIKVVYSAGYSTIPYDLKGITYTVAARMWKQRQEKNWGVSTFSRSDMSHSLEDGEYTAREFAVLNRYCRHPKVRPPR